MNAKSVSKIISSLIALSTILSCSSININGSIKEYTAPEKGLVLSIVSEQNEIRIRNPSNLYFPLDVALVVAIGNIRLTNTKEKALDSILNDLKDFDFSSQISEKIKESVSHIDLATLNRTLNFI